MKPSNFGSILAKLISAVMLFAALGRQAYDYYTLLRWIACGVCAYTAFQAGQVKKTGWLWIFAIGAIILNPVAPLHLKRDTWAIVDTAAGVLLLVAIVIIDIRNAVPASAVPAADSAPAPPLSPASESRHTYSIAALQELIRKRWVVSGIITALLGCVIALTWIAIQQSETITDQAVTVEQTRAKAVPTWENTKAETNSAETAKRTFTPPPVDSLRAETTRDEFAAADAQRKAKFSKDLAAYVEKMHAHAEDLTALLPNARGDDYSATFDVLNSVFEGCNEIRHVQDLQGVEGWVWDEADIKRIKPVISGMMSDVARGIDDQIKSINVEMPFLKNQAGIATAIHVRDDLRGLHALLLEEDQAREKDAQGPP